LKDKFVRFMRVALPHSLIIAPLVVCLVLLDWGWQWRLVTGALLLVIELFFIILGRDFFSEYAGKAFWAVLVLYVTALISAALLDKFGPSRWTPNNTVSGRSADHGSETLLQVLNPATPGTLFALFAATITVVGFTITILRLQETHIRISHYDRFLLRLARLLRITLQAHRRFFSIVDPVERFFKLRGTEYLDRAGLKILCTVPTLGNMSHHDLYLSQVHWLWREIADCNSLSVEMVCIDGTEAALGAADASWSRIEPSKEKNIPIYSDESILSASDAKNNARVAVRDKTPIGRFYTHFKELNFTDHEVIRGMLEAIEIVTALEDKHKRNSVVTYDWRIQPEASDGVIKQPHFHLFWTRRRAIVAIPLDRDLPRENMHRVTMIGYETTDADVIERLFQVYTEYRDTSKSQKAEGEPTPPVTELTR